MIGKLRCNIIWSDWYNELSYYYSIMGRSAQYAAMNIRTLESVISYTHKNPQYGYLSISRDYVNAQNGRGNIVTSFLNGIDIGFCGVSIIIDNTLEDERMKVW